MLDILTTMETIFGDVCMCVPLFTVHILLYALNSFVIKNHNSVVKQMV